MVFSVKPIHVRTAKKIIQLRGNVFLYEKAEVFRVGNTIHLLVLIESEWYRRNAERHINYLVDLMEKYVAPEIYYDVTINSSALGYDLMAHHFKTFCV
jgi:hypothetical protein